jgi:Cd2+/Zn2+-exporting ATPase
MLVCDGSQVRGFISVSDALRNESGKVVAELKNMQITPAMLTGDNRIVAHNVGVQLGIDSVRADLLPEEKVHAILALRSMHGEVVMVGDGINDSPALAAADIGIAMGGAKHAQVLETADIVLMTDDLNKLPLAIKISAYANRLITQNITFSLLVKFIAAALAILGWVPLWAAVIADMGVSVLVTINGMRVLRFEVQEG